jgi:subtilisin family serine protease
VLDVARGALENGC